MIKTVTLIALLAGSAAAAPAADKLTMNFREEEALDVELETEAGRRELFPLLPGTKCPAGHHCRARASNRYMNAATLRGNTRPNVVSPLAASLKDNLKVNLNAVQESQLNDDLNTAVSSRDYCARRSAMARAAGLAMGLMVGVVNEPAFAAQTVTVGMGTDSGQLVFNPAETKICKGDSVKWVIVKGGPHNVVFDEAAIPAGVKQEDISMDEQIGDEGDTFVKQFDVAGNYDYYCEPHRSAGMNGKLIVA